MARNLFMLLSYTEKARFFAEFTLSEKSEILRYRSE